MTHLALRNTKRGKKQSGSDITGGSELAALVTILVQILLTWYRWIKISFVNLHLVNYRSYDPIAELSQTEVEDDFDLYEPGTLVVARGIGLMAAYTGRRAMFAIYPASGEGLEVSSRGPAPITFEYKKKDGMFLVGYVPRAAGKYQLQVARFGRKALGSPFLLLVDDPPPGYVGNFGAALWRERPPQLPLLSGIVDFVTEKMFLTEDGRLVKLNKNGTDMVPVTNVNNTLPPPVAAHRPKAEKELENNNTKDKKNFEKPPPAQEAPSPPQNDDTKKIMPVKKQVVSRIENILSTINRDSKKDPQDKYKYVSKALMKELSLSLKLLNILGSDQENLSTPESSPDADSGREYATQEELGDSVRVVEVRNQSGGERFLSKQRESRYAAQRAGKLAWHWGDDAVAGGACDVDGRSDPAAGGRREGFIGSMLQGGGGSRPWKKYGVSGFLGLRKTHEPTGVRLLHNIYRPSDGTSHPESLKGYNKYSARNLNNATTHKPEYQNNINVRSERNNLEAERRNQPVKNYDRKGVAQKSSDSVRTQYPVKQNRWKTKDLRPNGNFRTLSLPDFNRILSLSVQGLRKAKSCGDRSFRAMSSNSFSLSLKNLFDKEQVYNLSTVHKENVHKHRKTKPGATLVKLAHYGSDRNSRKMNHGMKSVDEWKKYWEEKQSENADTEYGKGCSLELTGIVDQRKAMFDSNPETTVPEIKIIDVSRAQNVTTKDQQVFETSKLPQHSFSVRYEIQKSPCMLTPSPVSNKTAFQKAKDMFEGSYDPKEFDDEKDNRKKNISERFHVSSLSRDIQSGATPELLGVPNRMPAVASLGSTYHPHYPHIPLSPSRPRFRAPEMEQYAFPAWDIILHSDPNYV